MKKRAFKEVINKAYLVHGDKYDYTQSDYIYARTKIKIYCNNCNDYFFQTPDHHINRKQGCLNCSKIRRSNLRKMTLDEFLIKANSLFGNKYLYDKIVWNKCSDKILIGCPIHNTYFYQTGSAHLQGKGCKQCQYDKLSIDNSNNAVVTKEGYVDNCRKRKKSFSYLYVFYCYNHNEKFIKIGISLKPQKRKTSIPYSIEICNLIYGPPGFVWELEKAIHENLKDYKYQPLIKFNGYTECFNISVLEDARFDSKYFNINKILNEKNISCLSI